MPAPIYLDNNSTTAMLPEVIDAVTDCLLAGHLNPASQHASGRAARRVLEQSREEIGCLLGASLDAPHRDHIIITSGGTESNNLAIRGLVREPGEVLISSIEHPSALEAANELKRLGCSIREIPVTRGGHVILSELEQMLGEQTRLVCLMMGNNEVGTLQPVVEVARLCQERQIPLHTDGVQVVGKLSVNFRELGVSSLAFSAHKFHGPRGIGGLLVRDNVTLQPLLVGGSQQLGLRPGTESVAAVVGMATALRLFNEQADERAIRLAKLRDLFESTLVNGTDLATINGVEPRLPHTTNISFAGLERQPLVMALDLAGVECSTGSACTSGSSEPSHVLVAMGCEKGVIESSIRFSFSVLLTESDVLQAADRILSVINNLRMPK